MLLCFNYDVAAFVYFLFLAVKWVRVRSMFVVFCNAMTLMSALCPLVCKTVTRVCRASFRPDFSENAQNS